jgi:hypothetical protein
MHPSRLGDRPMCVESRVPHPAAYLIARSRTTGACRRRCALMQINRRGRNARWSSPRFRFEMIPPCGLLGRSLRLPPSTLIFDPEPRFRGHECDSKEGGRDGEAGSTGPRLLNWSQNRRCFARSSPSNFDSKRDGRFGTTAFKSMGCTDAASSRIRQYDRCMGMTAHGASCPLALIPAMSFN